MIAKIKLQDELNVIAITEGIQELDILGRNLKELALLVDSSKRERFYYLLGQNFADTKESIFGIPVHFVNGLPDKDTMYLVNYVEFVKKGLV